MVFSGIIDSDGQLEVRCGLGDGHRVDDGVVVRSKEVPSESCGVEDLQLSESVDREAVGTPRREPLTTPPVELELRFHCQLAEYL